MSIFHLAFRVDDIESTRQFYTAVLKCPLGRETAHWIDFNFFGHQISAHVGPRPETELRNDVDGDIVPVPHFGVVLDWPVWEGLSSRLAAAGIEFLLKPKVRFAGQPGEQGTFFLRDPSDNVLEFKTFRESEGVFATE